MSRFLLREEAEALVTKIVGWSDTARLAGTEAGGALVMPALRARDFRFTSLSDAV